MTLILHPATERIANAYINNPPHALLITGAHGVGASSLAHYIATRISANILTVLPEKDEKVDLEKGIISVNLIRQLYQQTRTTIKSRVIIIDYAERMAPAAQNAFLKLLEEPIAGTFFILVSHEPTKILPTVHSRVQQLAMLPVTRQQTEALLTTLGITNSTKHTQLLYMASGLPAEITRLARDDDYFEKNASFVRDAKTLLQGSPYDKITLAHKYKEDRQGILKVLDVAIGMARHSLSSNVGATTSARLEQLCSVYDAVTANGNIRLQLVHAML